MQRLGRARSDDTQGVRDPLVFVENPTHRARRLSSWRPAVWARMPAFWPCALLLGILCASCGGQVHGAGEVAAADSAGGTADLQDGTDGHGEDGAKVLAEYLDWVDERGSAGEQSEAVIDYWCDRLRSVAEDSSDSYESRCCRIQLIALLNESKRYSESEESLSSLMDAATDEVDRLIWTTELLDVRILRLLRSPSPDLGSASFELYSQVEHRLVARNLELGGGASLEPSLSRRFLKILVIAERLGRHERGRTRWVLSKLDAGREYALACENAGLDCGPYTPGSFASQAFHVLDGDDEVCSEEALACALELVVTHNPNADVCDYCAQCFFDRYPGIMAKSYPDLVMDWIEESGLGSGASQELAAMAGRALGAQGRLDRALVFLEPLLGAQPAWASESSQGAWKARQARMAIVYAACASMAERSGAFDLGVDYLLALEVSQCKSHEQAYGLIARERKQIEAGQLRD